MESATPVNHPESGFDWPPPRSCDVFFFVQESVSFAHSNVAPSPRPSHSALVRQFPRLFLSQTAGSPSMSFFLQTVFFSSHKNVLMLSLSQTLLGISSLFFVKYHPNPKAPPPSPRNA